MFFNTTPPTPLYTLPLYIAAICYRWKESVFVCVCVGGERERERERGREREREKTSFPAFFLYHRIYVYF